MCFVCVACCALIVFRCSLCVDCRLVFHVCGLLLDVVFCFWLLLVACCSLFVARCLLIVA